MDGGLNLDIKQGYSLINHIAPSESLCINNFKVIQETATLAPNTDIEIKDPETRPMLAIGMMTGYGHAVNPSRKRAAVLKMMQ